MKKIKVYNISKLIEKEMPDKKVFEFTQGLAIIEGKNGLFVCDNEGVGWKKDSVKDIIEIGLTDIPEENKLYMFPQYKVDADIEELLKAEYTEMLLTEFIDRYEYNDRLIRNFRVVLDAINEIGLNSKDYYIKETN